MSEKIRFPFQPAGDRDPVATGLPYLPLQLSVNDLQVQNQGLLNTGATVNVLPHRIGVELGLNWDEAVAGVELTGNLARFEARGVLVMAQVDRFEPVQLALAWTRSPEAPLILGQVNFFMAFDVCFYRSRQEFDVSPRS